MHPRGVKVSVTVGVTDRGRDRGRDRGMDLRWEASVTIHGNLSALALKIDRGRCKVSHATKAFFKTVAAAEHQVLYSL